MAEGGSDTLCDETDATTGLSFEQTRIEQQERYDEVGEQATVLLEHFIVDRFQQDGVENAPGLDDLREGHAVSVEQDGIWSEIEGMLRAIANTLDRDRELQRMINLVPEDSPIEAIIAIAHIIFGDGKITWGRIVGLFYLAYRMAVRAIKNFMVKNFPNWVNKLIQEVVKFLVIKFAKWIISKGGWLAVREYMSSPTWIWGTLMTLSASCLLFTLYKLSTPR